MRIKRICFPVTVLGPGERIGIWTTGCSFNCPGCMTPELQSLQAGNEITVENIISCIDKIKTEAYRFTISGGEPFEQADELVSLIDGLSQRYGNDIIIYTGYRFDELEQRFPEHLKRIVENVAVVVDGRYVDELNDGKGLRGSSNQKIHIFRDYEKYSYMLDCKRQLQVFDHKENFSLVIGIL